MVSLRQKIGLGIIAAFLLLNIFAWKEVFILAGPHYLKVEVLDINQGDAIFIETPAMRHIIIDGGPDSSVLEKLQSRLPFWQRRLDMIVLTHPDLDHVMGLLHILQKYQVDYIVWTGMVRDGAHYEKWIELTQTQKAKGSHMVIAKAGDKIKSGGAELAILHPFESLAGQFFKETNDTGIVARLQYGSKSFLFTADVSSKLEQKLIDAKAGLASDVLKVGHHGSKYSSSEVFLQAVNPSMAAISVGAKNTYGHPTAEVLQRLANFGINVLRTDVDGDITFLSDGQHIQIK